jgi:hypothetical protein
MKYSPTTLIVLISEPYAGSTCGLTDVIEACDYRLIVILFEYEIFWSIDISTIFSSIAVIVSIMLGSVQPFTNPLVLNIASVT